MYKWAQRDKRLALVMLVDLGLALLVGLVIFVQFMAPAVSGNTNSGKTTVVAVTPTAATGPVYSLTLAPLPTVNPTPLVALPNQGQSEAPPAPAGFQAPDTGNSITLTPTPAPGR